jgi:Rps23 Pro-64 3,4-dihydroxylase Tpa1-like proline 4-hydroxylase
LNAGFLEHENNGMNRVQLAEFIDTRLGAESAHLAREWHEHAPLNYFSIDNLLPRDLAMRVRQAFPQGEAMTLKDTLRERKYIASQMNRHDPLLEEIVYAFQEPSIVARVAQITGLRALEPDSRLYAGGVSMMARGHFLNPHIDNSHDMTRARYRVLNLLYYVSPDWRLENGGNLELWPQGLRGGGITVESVFNRLVVMVTHRSSWHSVSPINVDSLRCCVSNYYFSKLPVGETEYFHVTSFRGRPGQPIRDAVLRVDAALREGIRKLFPKGVKKTTHYYDRSAK